MNHSTDIAHLINMLKQLDELSGKRPSDAVRVIDSVLDGVKNLGTRLSVKELSANSHKLYIGLVKSALKAPDEASAGKLLNAADRIRTEHDVQAHARQALQTTPMHPLDSEVLISTSVWWARWINQVVEVGRERASSVDIRYRVLSRLNTLAPEVGNVKDPSGLLKGAQFDHEEAAILLKHFASVNPGALDVRGMLRESPNTWQRVVILAAFPQLDPSVNSALER
jgi:hypothetical protein